MSVVEAGRSVASHGRAAERELPFRTVGAMLPAWVLAGSLALGFAALSLTGVPSLELGAPRSLPTILGAALLLVAGSLSWRLADAAPRGVVDRVEWRLTAIVFAMLALDQAASLHEWVRIWTGAGWTASFMPLVVVAAAVWSARGLRLADRPASLVLWTAGAAAWLGAQLPEAFGSAGAQHGAAAALELGGTALLALALAFALPGGRRAWQPAAVREAARSRLERLVIRVDLRRATLLVAVTIAFILVVSGLLHALDLHHDKAAEGPVTLADRPWQWLDVRQELSFSTYFSGLQLGVAAALALLLGHLRVGGSAPLIWIVLALIFAAMGLDDIIDLHDELQTITGELAQVTLAPLVAGVGLLGLVCASRIRAHRPALMLFVAGGIAWVAALGLDWWMAEHPISGPWLNHESVGLAEEAFEMYGSAIIVLALALAARTAIRRRSLPESSPPEPATAPR